MRSSRVPNEQEDLFRAADADNYAHPLASRLKHDGLVSVWCTKQHCEQSYVWIEAARKMPRPSRDVRSARTTASAEKPAYEEIHAAVAAAAELLPGSACTRPRRSCG